MTKQHRPSAVPYIAAWEHEALPIPVLTQSLSGIGYLDERPHDRDGAGVLWRRWESDPGVGEPRLGDVHGPRQRHCMRQMLCQVCAEPADRDERGWLWLLQDDPERRAVYADWPEDELTAHPPVCLRCAPDAVRRCPHLRGRAVAVRVREVITDGLWGLRYVPGPFVPLTTGKPEVELTVRKNACQWFLADQVAVALHGCTIVDLDDELARQSPGSRAGSRR